MKAATLLPALSKAGSKAGSNKSEDVRIPSVEPEIPDMEQDHEDSAKGKPAHNLARRFRAVIVDEAGHYPYIFATFHGFHKASDDWKKWSLKLLLAALVCVSGRPARNIAGRFGQLAFGLIRRHRIKSVRWRVLLGRALGMLRFHDGASALGGSKTLPHAHSDLCSTGPLPCIISGDINCTYSQIKCVHYNFQVWESEDTDIDHVITYNPVGSAWRLKVSNLVRTRDPDSVLDHPILNFMLLLLRRQTRVPCPTVDVSL